VATTKKLSGLAKKDCAWLNQPGISLFPERQRIGRTGKACLYENFSHLIVDDINAL
jgi:hypothetical protein